MDRFYQDISIENRKKRTSYLVIPRGSHIKRIVFDEVQITVFYIDHVGNQQFNFIHYEDLEKGERIVID